MKPLVIYFDLEGKMACFKKYYSNKNVLSYEIPPKTVLLGMIASVLKLPKDSYYDDLSQENINIGINIKKAPKKYVATVNHLKSTEGRRQVPHEFLLAKEEKIAYSIYLLIKNQELYDQLKNKLIQKDLGYGLSLGQQQFKGYITNLKYDLSYSVHKNYQGAVESLIPLKNIKALETMNSKTLVKEIMPLSFKKVKKGREPLKYEEVIYEQSGLSILGVFHEVYEVNGQYICVFSRVV